MATHQLELMLEGASRCCNSVRGSAGHRHFTRRRRRRYADASSSSAFHLHRLGLDRVVLAGCLTSSASVSLCSTDTRHKQMRWDWYREDTGKEQTSTT